MSGVCVELHGADLAGQVAVGTCLSVFGTAKLDRQPDNNAVRAWADIQVLSFSTSWHALTNRDSLPGTGGLPQSADHSEMHRMSHCHICHGSGYGSSCMLHELLHLTSGKMNTILCKVALVIQMCRMACRSGQTTSLLQPHASSSSSLPWPLTGQTGQLRSSGSRSSC